MHCRELVQNFQDGGALDGTYTLHPLVAERSRIRVEGGMPRFSMILPSSSPKRRLFVSGELSLVNTAV